MNQGIKEGMVVALVVVLLVCAVVSIVWYDVHQRQELEVIVGTVGFTTDYTCSVTNQTGLFSRLSSTSYTAYPLMNSTIGGKQCTNGFTKGVWQLTPKINNTVYDFNPDHCIFAANHTQVFCFGSTNATEDKLIVDCLANKTRC